MGVVDLFPSDSPWLESPDSSESSESPDSDVEPDPSISSSSSSSSLYLALPKFQKMILVMVTFKNACVVWST